MLGTVFYNISKIDIKKKFFQVNLQNFVQILKTISNKEIISTGYDNIVIIWRVF